MDDQGNPFEGMSGNKKFDIQLTNAQADELALSEIFTHPERIAKIEVKGESYIWEKTGNIFIEYEHNGKPSGIAATDADMWVHAIKSRDGVPLLYLMFPAERLLTLCREAYHAGRRCEDGGDGGKSKGVLLRLVDLLRAT